MSLSFSYCKDADYILKTFFSKPIAIENLSLNLDTCKVGDKGISKILNQIDSKKIKYLHMILSSTKSTYKIGKILG